MPIVLAYKRGLWMSCGWSTLLVLDDVAVVVGKLVGGDHDDIDQRPDAASA